ncbi:MAG: dTDP-4-dehydrorhamnose reductase [Cellulosilyticum sp.]|nr:dTDP-4-dehydrorhamnose reductase [Cellulosilyticum sp.]
MKRIWIIGANGQLGTAINELLDRREIEVLNTDKDDVDVTDINRVVQFADLNRPEIIINCAGLTSIRECEEDVEKAYKINAVGSRNVSIASRRIEAKLVHLSTDDVFSGEKYEPYNEFDIENPKSIYGKSKLAGERFVKEFAERYFIIRSTWIYGKGENFIKDFITQSYTKDTICVAKDAFGCPTSAKELAKFVIHLMNTSEYGLYHAVCEGQCSRYEFAEEIIKQTGLNIKLKAVLTEEDELMNQRPVHIVLDDLMLRLLGNYKMPTWEEALADYIKELN